MSTIWNEFKKSKELGKAGVLATIIQVEGSAYQKEGTKCFISEDGVLIGLLSGGCVESDIIEHAKEVWESRCPKIIRYDFRGDEDDLWGMGVGCNGAITIFLEIYDPIQYPQRAKRIELSLMRQISESQTAVTVIQSPVPDVIGEKWIAHDSVPAIPEHLIRNVQAALALQTKGIYTLQEGGEVWKFFFDLIEPVPKLLMIGAGPDAVPVVRGAKELGWYVTVMDHRQGYLHQLGFQCADQLVHSLAGHSPNVNIDKNTFIVIMSHHFQQDQLMLGTVIPSDAPYIGILGPRHRTERMLANMEPTRGGITEDKLKRIHSPIGLDIGSKTPEEIALSILAEMTACYRRRQSCSLREAAGEIKVDKRAADPKCLSA